MNNTTTAVGNLEAVATNTAFGNISDIKDSHNVNASGYYFEEDLEIPSLLTELQTVLLACLATLIPLGLALASVFAIRFIWKKYIDTVAEGYEGVLHRDESCESNKNSHLLLPDEIKTSESQFSVIPAEELEEVMTTYSNAQGENSANHTSKSTANGSIITMTMKNNHLIVETEERVLGINETPSSMLYSNGDSESVFVVELQSQEVEEETSNLQEVPEILEDETALIHQAEEEEDDEEDDDDDDVNSDDEVIMKQGPNTGLSQSDLSASSVGSVNRCYSYGNQIEYVYDGRDNKHNVNHNVVATISDSKAKASIPNCKLLTGQQSQDVVDDVDEDELYLAQQRQLGNGLGNSNKFVDQNDQQKEEQRYQKQEEETHQQQQDQQQKLPTISIPDITYTEYDQQKVNV